jgi:hypothetical protein
MRRIWAIGAVVPAMLMFATTAAAGPVGPWQRMRFETSNGGRLFWMKTLNDSSTDANHRALKLVLPPNSPECSDQNLAACSFGRVFSRATTGASRLGIR